MAAPNARAAQDFIPIREIRNDVVVLKDGSMRALVLGSSLNFALKSPDEQQAIIAQFQSFLNSVEFPIQFFIQSRDLDIRPYLALLEERVNEQVNELLQIQISEYIHFIKGFVENVNIMSKNFIIVVPYAAAYIGGAGSKKNVLSTLGLGGGKKGKEAAESKLRRFEENRSQLEQRLSIVEQGLARIGVRAARLGTEELVELFYKQFNPGELGKPIASGDPTMQQAQGAGKKQQ